MDTLTSPERDPFATVTPALVAALERAYPQACPHITDSDRMIWFKAGQASVVSFLKQKFKDNK